MSSHRVQVGEVSYWALHHCPPGVPVETPPVLLIHALMANHHMWDGTVKALNNAGYPTLQVDHIGHNNTTAPLSYASGVGAPAFHFDEMTLAHSIIASSITGQDKVEAVIGCSMGGVLALRYAQLFPGRIRNCIIACGTPGATSPESFKSLWSERYEQFKTDKAAGTEVLAQATVKRWLPGEDDESEQARQKALDMVRKCTLDGYKICADGISSYDYHSDLKEIKTRTLILAGREDSAIGPAEVTENLANEVPGAKLVWMDHTGHLPSIHRPKEFENIALDFLRMSSK